MVAGKNNVVAINLFPDGTSPIPPSGDYAQLMANALNTAVWPRR